jgi:hypothetical protein
VRRECLDRLLIFGRRQLEHVLRVYILWVPETPSRRFLASRDLGMCFPMVALAAARPDLVSARTRV